MQKEKKSEQHVTKQKLYICMYTSISADWRYNRFKGQNKRTICHKFVLYVLEFQLAENTAVVKEKKKAKYYCAICLPSSSPTCVHEL